MNSPLDEFITIYRTCFYVSLWRLLKDVHLVILLLFLLLLLSLAILKNNSVLVFFFLFTFAVWVSWNIFLLIISLFLHINLFFFSIIFCEFVKANFLWFSSCKYFRWISFYCFLLPFLFSRNFQHFDFSSLNNFIAFLVKGSYNI